MGGPLVRALWLARELVLPWELDDAEVVFTALTTLFPLAARVRGAPAVCVFDFHLATLWDRSSPLRRRQITAALRSAAAVVCLSDVQRRRLLERVRLDPGRLHACLLGIDHHYFQPSSEPEEPYVVAVGKDLARDYETLARAAEGLDVPVVVVTEERNVRGIDLPANVEVTRDLPYTELRELYARAACVVLPVRGPDYAYGTESGGLTALMEAMAMGKAVVLSDRPIFAEYTRGGEAVSLVPAEDPDALRETIGSLLADAELRARLGRAARALVEEKLTMERFAEQLDRVARSVRRR
jgi:glycosyltransferase involved in cell wall biosynthesis